MAERARRNPPDDERDTGSEEPLADDSTFAEGNDQLDEEGCVISEEEKAEREGKPGQEERGPGRKIA